MSHVRRREACRAASLALVLAMLAGCAGSPAREAAPAGPGAEAAATAMLTGQDVQVDLAVRDFALRPTDEACAAARPYLDLHPTQSFVVRGADGSTIVDGELPQGRSVKATDIDFGAAEREPTFCVFSLRLPGLADGSYVLSAGDDRAIPFTVPHQDAGPIPVTFPPIAPGGSDPFGREARSPELDPPQTREP